MRPRATPAANRNFFTGRCCVRRWPPCGARSSPESSLKLADGECLPGVWTSLLISGSRFTMARAAVDIQDEVAMVSCPVTLLGLAPPRFPDACSVRAQFADLVLEPPIAESRCERLGAAQLVFGCAGIACVPAS